MPTIIVGGDVCPVGKHRESFLHGTVASTLGALAAEFTQADLRVLNLECALIESPSPINKNGPTLGVKRQAIQGLSALAVDIVNLANNHVMDHGRQGLTTTLAACRDAGIRTVGAGKDLRAASEPVVVECGGIRLGVCAFADHHELSLAGDHREGTAPCDLIAATRLIEALRERCDHVLVLLHAGVENYPLPSPRQVEKCRFLVDQGAGAVLCQHTHVPGCHEVYRDRVIVYGQGDLLVDHRRFPTAAYRQGFLVKLTMQPQAPITSEFIPYCRHESGIGIRPLSPAEEQAFRQTLADRAALIADPVRLGQMWAGQCREREAEYLGAIFLPPSRLLRKLNRLTRFLRPLITRRQRSFLEDVLLDGSHHEILTTILERHRDKE